MMSDIFVEFIRHGLPEGGDCYRGNGVDDPLSPKGWEQMRASVGDDDNWDQIITSPMQRCIRFAEELAEKLDKPLTVEPGFIEIGFGAWEGKTKKELREKDPEAFEAFFLDAVNNRPAGAEPLQSFQDRAWSTLERVIDTFPQQRLLVVAHAGILRAVTCAALDIPLTRMYDIHIRHATRIRFDLVPRPVLVL